MLMYPWKRAAAVLGAALLIPAGFVTFAGAAGAAPGCAHRVASDVNGDGHADVVSGEPGRDLGGLSGVGQIQVFFGTGSGLSAGGSQTVPAPGARAAGEMFGSRVAVGDFNGDCFSDVAVAAPGISTVFVLFGSRSGLKPARSVRIADADPDAYFGTDLAVGDFNGDGVDDLAASAQYATVDGLTEAGAVGIMYGGAGGLGGPITWITRATPGVPGAVREAERFGTQLAAGDFNGDGRSDLALGTPLATVGDVGYAGSVTILLGTATGLTGTGAQQWTESSPGVPGVAEDQDFFGATLATGDVNGDGRADLVVGSPGESVGSVPIAGSITYLPGAATGLTAHGAKAFSQATPGVPGTAETADSFGTALAVADFNGDGYAEIAVGTWSEDIGTVEDAGTVTILPGTRSGPTASGARVWDQKTAGIKGGVGDGKQFGATLYGARIRSAHQVDLVVGVTGQVEGSDIVGALSVINGSASGLTAAGNRYITGPAGPGPRDVGWLGTSIA